MTNVTLPAFPALVSGALVVKGIANDGALETAAQYLTFGHCFQIGQLPTGGGLSVNFGSGSIPCQVDVKTGYADGSAAHALVTVRVPSVPAGTTTWGQFSASAVPTAPALSLVTALGKTTLALALTSTALADWTPSAELTGGAIIRPSGNNAGGYVFQFNNASTTTGTTGATEPMWPQTPSDGATAGTVTDGTVTWTNVSTGLPNTITENLMALVVGAPFDPWLSGPLVVQGRAMATLYQGLRVVIDITAYADGTINADVMLANDIAMLPAAGTLCFTATLALNGSTAYTSPALVHYQYQNWTARVGTVPGGIRVIHDPNDFIAAQAVPPYTTTLGVDPGNQSLAQSCMNGAQFGQPLVNSPVNPASTLVSQVMGGEGGRTDIGPNDSWSVWGLITQDATFEAVALEAAKVNGVIPWHMWNAGTDDYYTCEDQAGLWWQSQGPGSWTIGLTQAISVASNWQLDQAHFPELVYLAYLTSGRRYYLDELNATTRAMILLQWPIDRNLGNDREYGGTLGYIVYGGQIRGGAWTLRNILYACYANPDGGAQKAYARRMLDNNFTWLNEQTADWTTFEGQMAGYIPIGVCCVYGDGTRWPPWQQDYFFSTIMMAATMGYAPAQQFAEWMGTFIVGRFAQDIPGWYPADGIVYNFVAFTNNGAYTPGTSVAVPTWAAEETLLQAEGGSQVTISTGAPVTTWNGAVITEPAGTPVNTWNHQAGDYGQLAANSLAGAQVIGLASSADAYDWLASVGSPFTDPASWADGPLVQMVPRTLNASQVLGAGPAADEVDGTVVLAALVASGVTVSGPDVASGTAVFGRTVATGSAGGPTYVALATLLASAISDLNRILAVLQQWATTLAAEVKSAPPGTAKAYLRWQEVLSAEVTRIQRELAEFL